MTDQQYYNGNEGSYQYVTLKDIVNNFILMYVGDDSLVAHNTNRYTIVFHAKRGIQELYYDAARETRNYETKVGENLKVIMPPDFVSYVKMYIDVNGTLVQMFEAPRPNRAYSVAEDSSGNVIFDSNGDSIEVESLLTQEALNNLPLEWSPLDYWGWFINDQWYFPQNWVRYGLNTAEATNAPTFRVNKASGVIDFSSGASGKNVVIEYISDGLADDDDMIMVNKMAEEYLYTYIRWAILNSKSNVPEYAILRARKDKMANLRNAKIRMSNMHPGRLLMTMRGKDKWIK